MLDYIKISTLNDFIFCPKSIYFHELYDNNDTSLYHEEIQTLGKLNHENIDNQKYSSSKKILQGMTVFSEKYRILGKIDLFHTEKKSLMERKTKIKKIYKGYLYQLYAQYFCMTEMGYEILVMKFYSIQDNQVYPIKIPGYMETHEFEKFLKTYRGFDPNDRFYRQNENKCNKCIYKELCDN